MEAVRTGLGMLALAGFLLYVAGEVKICDIGDGCGHGYPGALYYGGAIVCICSLLALAVTALVGLRRRP